MKVTSAIGAAGHNVLVEEPTVMNVLATKSSESIEEQMHDELVHCFGSARRLVRLQRDQQNDETLTCLGRYLSDSAETHSHAHFSAL